MQRKQLIINIEETAASLVAKGIKKGDYLLKANGIELDDVSNMDAILKASKGENIKTAFRLCGIRCCRKLPNFPMKTIDELLQTYLPKTR